MPTKDKNALFTELERLKLKIADVLEFCDSEEQTKISLINPTIEVFGHDVRNPKTVRLEFDVSIRGRTERVDYALLRDREPVVLIEAKSAQRSLNDERILAQVISYAQQQSSVSFIALTNGIEWRWFRKYMDNHNHMKLESEPFLTHSILQPSEQELEFLSDISRICDKNFDMEKLHNQADETHLASSMLGWLKEQETSVDYNLIKLLLHRSGKIATEKRRKSAEQVWYKTFKNYVDRKIDGTLERAKQSEETKSETLPEVEKVVFSGMKRSWRVKGEGDWRKERNATELMKSVTLHLASLDIRGERDYFESLAGEDSGVWHISSWKQDTSQWKEGDSPNNKYYKELEHGYWMFTCLSNPSKHERLKIYARNVRTNRKDQELELQDFVEVQLEE